MLVDRGLSGAIPALADRAPVPVDVDVPAERFPDQIEAAVYFLVAEGLTNVAKHAGARRARVSARACDDALLVEVSDDGRGGTNADVAPGTGLRGLADRVAAVGGTLAVDSPAGGGTALRARLPLSAPAT